MTDQIVQKVKEHWCEIIGNEFMYDNEAIFCTKFCQRIVQLHTKVLFLISTSDTPLCIIKTVRDKVFNSNLKKEKENQQNFFKAGAFRVPKIYFEDEIRGYYLYAEEVVWGKMVSKNDLLANEKKIIQSIASLPAYESIDISRIYGVFRDCLKDDTSIVDFIKQLEGKGGALKVGLTHNDFARQNMVKKGKSFHLIDFERAGDCPLWLIDATSLLKKIYHINDLADWKNMGASRLIDYTGVDGQTAEVLYSIVMIIDYLYQKKPHQYKKVLQLIFNRQ